MTCPLAPRTGSFDTRIAETHTSHSQILAEKFRTGGPDEKSLDEFRVSLDKSEGVVKTQISLAVIFHRLRVREGGGPKL